MLRTVFSKAMWVGKAKVLVLALGLLVTLFGFLAVNPADAASTFTVNSGGDASDKVFTDGSTDNKCDTGNSANPFVFVEECTLRAAIEQANVTPGADTINVEIPTDFFDIANAHCDQTTKVCTISPASPLPAITGAVNINAYTQDGASPNTLANGNNAVLKVVLSGTHPNSGLLGLQITASNVTVGGLVINEWDSTGVSIKGSGSSGNKVMGNFIGTDATGTQKLGNFVGVQVSGPNNTIGGTAPSARNLISGNGATGVQISGATGNKIMGNFIGTNVEGTHALGNSGSGVNIGSASGTIVGGVTQARNVIAFNKFYGLRNESGSTRNRILSNSIHSNGRLGIELLNPSGEGGVTRNDPRDPDLGGNTLQNYPTLSSATTASGETTIKGSLNSRPNKSFTIQFFSSPKADPSGFGEGKKFLGQKSVTTNTDGNASFTFEPAVTVAAGQFVTATATDENGNTSEFSRAGGVERG